jgi:hypothetical protein
METITIQFLKEDVIPIIDMLMFNIFSLKDQMYMDDDLDYSEAISFYKQQINTLRPVLKELDPINYIIYDACDFDYTEYEN